MNSASRSAAIENFELGNRQYKQEQWLEAACSFDKAIQLGNKDPRAIESKAKCFLRQSQLETKEFARTKTGSDGNAMYEAAYKTALRAMQKHGKERWQPFYILADILYHRQQYTLAESYLAKIPPHPSFTSATSQQKASVRKYAERIAHDRRYVRQRVAGRAETEAVVNDLHRLEETRKRTNFEHVLSPDIFLRIVELARDTDPRLAVRMSGVCSRWRSILAGQPGVWQRLIIGKGPYVGFKVKTYLERCGRGLKELQITEGFDANRVHEVGKLLAPHARYIERLTIRLRSPGPLLSYFRGLMENLRYLNIQPSVEIHPGTMPRTTRLDFDLLPEASYSLREIHLRGVNIVASIIGEVEDVGPPDDDQNDDAERGGWIDNPRVQFRNLRILRLGQCVTTSNSMLDLFRYTPNLAEVHLDRVICQYSSGESKPQLIRLEHLKQWIMPSGHLTHGTGIIPFSYISAPNLETLDLGPWFGPTADLRMALEAEGLREALPKLRSLNLAKTDLSNDLLPLFRQMVTLEYLNLSRCSLSVTFLEALIKGMTEKAPLFPNLVALSLAGNLDLTAPILRDLVNSRLAEGDKIPKPSVASQKSSQKRSMFAATPGKAPNGGSSRFSQSSPSSKLNRSAPVSRPDPSHHTQMSTQLSIILDTPSSSPPAPIARLRWLNIDHCEAVDPLLLPALTKRIPFVSQWMGTPDEDRIAGKGRWSWELDLSLECRMKMGSGAVFDEGKCEIRANGDGNYHVHHVCGQGLSSQGKEAQGWEWTSQFTQPSQDGAGWKRKAKDKEERAVKGRLTGLQEE